MCVADDYEVVWDGGEGLTSVGEQPQRITIRVCEKGGRLVMQSVDLSSGTSEEVHRWLADACQRRWRRTVAYSRNASWPYCSLCGQQAVVYPRGAVSNRPHVRMFFTAHHRGVCQRCYVRWRMVRGLWPGLGVARVKRRAAQ